MRHVTLQAETALWKTDHVAGAVGHAMQSSTISLRPAAREHAGYCHPSSEGSYSGAQPVTASRMPTTNILLNFLAGIGTGRTICREKKTLLRCLIGDLQDAGVVLHPALRRVGNKPPLLLG